MSSPLLDAEPVTPSPSLWPRAFAGAVLVVGGLGLVLCGGAFLIGAMLLVKPQLVDPSIPHEPLSTEAGTLLMILYGLAAACFLGALTLFVFAMRALLSLFKKDLAVSS